MNRVGFKFGGILFLVLFIVLGLKPEYDSSKAYNKALNDAGSIRLQEMRVMSNASENLAEIANLLQGEVNQFKLQYKMNKREKAPKMRVVRGFS